jgi:ABC-2 type transport system permease protein
MLAAWTLWRREVVRFFRQRSRVIGVLATPLMFWLLMGSGFSYLDYLFPGALVQIVLFASIFSTISIIQDRHDGFLQGVLVAPVSNVSIVLGKVAGGATIALVQGAIFMVLGPLAGVQAPLSGWLAAAGILVLVGFALTSMGVLLAWRFESVQGFHGIMNLLLIPMWLLSGAVFPPDKAQAWVRGVMTANPLTYGVSAVRRALGGGGMDWAVSLGVTTAFAALMFALATGFARRR